MDTFIYILFGSGRYRGSYKVGAPSAAYEHSSVPNE